MQAALAAKVAEVEARYDEPHRRHHTRAHLAELAAELGAIRDLLEDPLACDLARCWHDAVYAVAEPDVRNNERASAALLRRDLAGLVAEPTLQRAEEMVMATRDHRVPPGLPPGLTQDCALFLDADMAVVAAEPDRYARYAADIAAEYEPIHGSGAYAAGRQAFLDGMLKRGRIFITDRSHAASDARARANMRWELERLAGGRAGSGTA